MDAQPPGTESRRSWVANTSHSRCDWGPASGMWAKRQPGTEDARVTREKRKGKAKVKLQRRKVGTTLERWFLPERTGHTSTGGISGVRVLHWEDG